MSTGRIKTLDQAFLSLSEGLRDAARAPNIKKYKPHEKQAIFHKSTKKKKLYIGGNRSGKTTGGVTEAIWRATCRHPFRPDLNAIGPNRGRVVAVSLTDGVEKIIFPQYQQWLYPSALKGGSWEDAYDKALRTLHFSNGSFIEFFSYDQDLEKFAGTSRHWIHFDEEPPQGIFIENRARLVDTDGDFWITMTPVEGMTWVYDQLYEPNLDNEDSDVEIIEIDMSENPYLTTNAIKNFTEGLDDDEKQARTAGKFVQVGGRIYKNFDPNIGGIHVLKEPIENPRDYFKNHLWIVSLDHGLNNPTAVLWSVVGPDGFVTVIHEYYQKDRTVDQVAAEIHKINKQLGRKPDFYVADPSIQNRNAVTGTSIHEEYVKYGIAFTLGNNDVKAGLVRVKRYLNPTLKNNGQPRLRISPNCNNLIWEMKKYRWKTYSNKKLAYQNNAFDEPHKKDDHACDALRYMIMTRPDLAAEPSAIDRVDDFLDGLNFEGHSVVKTSGPWKIADPNDTDSHPTWTKEDSTIRGSGAGGWQYDEHMGGIY